MPEMDTPLLMTSCSYVANVLKQVGRVTKFFCHNHALPLQRDTS